MAANGQKPRKPADTLGGIFTVMVTGCPVGLGSHTHWDRKLEARLCWAMMSIQAMKRRSRWGWGFEMARPFRRSDAHDEIFHSKERGFYRSSNNAGGFEGGMTTGEPIVLSVAMKPASYCAKKCRLSSCEPVRRRNRLRPRSYVSDCQLPFPPRALPRKPSPH